MYGFFNFWCFLLTFEFLPPCRRAAPPCVSERTKFFCFLDIKETAKKHNGIIQNLLPAHALSGCDTVASYFGVGKGTVIKILKQLRHDLSVIGNINAPIEDIIHQANAFISACYRVNDSNNMTSTRLIVWTKKNGKNQSSTSTINLTALLPTSEVYRENALRAHLQTITWRGVNNDPKGLNPENFGWKKEVISKTLYLIPLLKETKFASDYIMQMMKCGCDSETRLCKSKRCSCSENILPCTVLCACFQIGCSRVS